MSMTSTVWLIPTWVRPGPDTFLVLPLLTPTPTPKLVSPLWISPHRSPFPTCPLDPSSTEHCPTQPWGLTHAWNIGATTDHLGALIPQTEKQTMIAPKLCGDNPQPPYSNLSSFHLRVHSQPCLSFEASHHASSHLTWALASVPRSGRPERSHQERSRCQHQPPQPWWAREEAGDQAPEYRAEKARDTALRQSWR